MSIGIRQAPPQARFFTLPNGLVAEEIAATITLWYDPTTGACRAGFGGNAYLDTGADGVHQYTKIAGTEDGLSLDMAARMHKCYAPAGTTDPVTGADLAGVSVAGFMTIVKLAYDAEINARTQTMLDAAAQNPAAGDA